MYNNIYNYIKNNNGVSVDTLVSIFPDATINDIKYNILLNKSLTCEQNVRVGQEKFRKDLIKKYNNCVISKVVPDRCQACHIIPYSESNLNNKFDVDNGLLLRTDLHILFDKYLLSINPDNFTVCVNQNYMLKDTKMKKYDGLKINNNISVNTINNLRIHYNIFVNNCK